MGEFTCRSCDDDLKDKVAAALSQSRPDLHFRRSRNGEDSPRLVVDVICKRGHANSFRLTSSPRQ